MLMNWKQILDKYMDEGHTINRVFRNSKWHNVESYTPLKYDGIYEYIGYITIWNDVGCVENTFKMYRPAKGQGTILYE